MNDSKFLDLIKTVRFPLICLVVFSHSIGFSFDSVSLLDFSASNVYNFTTQIISHNIAKIAVCQFFFFSGYLFFRNVAPDFWNWCLKKWKNRIHTLLIPFVSWNLLAILAIIVKNLLFSLFGHYDAEEMAIVTGWHVLDWFRIPADFPLWYMEDLMFMIMISPLIYYIINRLKTWSLVLLLLIYVQPYEPGDVSMRAIFFFGFGAYCSLQKVDVLNCCKKFKIPSYILAVLTLLLAVSFNSAENHDWVIRFFYPFGIISFLNIIEGVIEKNPKIRERCQSLAETVFFIYGAHEIYILGWTKGICLRLLGESLSAQYLRYFLVPIITIIASVILYRIVKRLLPKSLAFVCGGR